MSGNRQFVDTNVLVYAHDVTAGDKHSRARALVEELWDTREGCLSVQVLQEFFVTTTRKIPSRSRPRKPRGSSAIWLTGMCMLPLLATSSRPSISTSEPARPSGTR